MGLFKIRQNQLKFIVLLSIVTLIITYIMVNSSSSEMLIAWGWQGDVADRNCILQIINPENQDLGNIYTNNESCNYQVTNIQGHPRLVWEQKEPRALVIYAITPKGDLVIEKTIPINEITIPSKKLNFQVRNDGTIYFGGILNNDASVAQNPMQLLHLDPQTEKITSLIDSKEGMIDFPNISPNSTHLVFSVFNGLKTWNDCQSSCASHYQLLDLETNSVVNLSSLMNQVNLSQYSHCLLQWSPNGQFIAFNVGCEAESSQNIVIFDVENNEVARVIKPIYDDAPYINVIGWLSN